MEAEVENSQEVTSGLQENSRSTSEESRQPQEESTTMSKKKKKRMERDKKWQEGREERRRREKEKKKLKKQQLREAGLYQNKEARTGQLVPMARSSNKVSLVIDCDFGQLMNPAEVKKLVKQINRCYSVNRHCQKPCQLFITSITDGIIKDTFMKNQSGYQNWDAHCLDTHWSKVFPDKSKVIYLTSDSDSEVPEIIAGSDLVFIIGGLVDHNRHKGLCHRLAVEAGVGHCRLPIDQHLKMTQRRVLAVNHVFEIMLSVSVGMSWSEALHKCIPSRKQQLEFA